VLDLAAADDTVRELLPEAGRLALRWFRTEMVPDDKGSPVGYDPVTEADRAVEAHLRAGIADAFPEHRIIGEEAGTSGPEDATATWIIDPIDGTKAFVTGMTGWGTLIGLSDGDDPVAGWVHQPFLGETFSAVAGQARYERAGAAPGPLRTSTCTDLAEARLYSTHPSMFATRTQRASFERVAAAVRLQRFGGDCYSYCLLAMGHVDLVVEASLQPYDIVPLIPIIEAAGGIITDRHGRRPITGGFVVAAATRPLHARALELVNEETTVA
jgi:histidinol phosphatase-like enzyme (inositol monophosphatase family)